MIEGIKRNQVYERGLEWNGRKEDEKMDEKGRKIYGNGWTERDRRECMKKRQKRQKDEGKKKTRIRMRN